MVLIFAFNATILLHGYVNERDPVIQCLFCHFCYVAYAWRSTFTWSEIKTLNRLVLKHHEMYVSLYDDAIPKFHWVLHMALDIWLCGPLRHITCFRCEAKHQYFKRLVSQLNWIGNVPQTMAIRHSRSIALRLHKAKHQTDVMGPIKVCEGCGVGVGPIGHVGCARSVVLTGSAWCRVCRMCGVCRVRIV